MKQLTDQGALQIIKSILDAATKNGIFSNLDESLAAINAYNHIHAKLSPKEEKKENA